MPWYLYIALKQLFPTGKRISFFSAMSILGVTLGVAVLVIVQSVMNGFGEEIRSKIVDTSGQVRVESGEIIYNQKQLLSLLRDEPEVIGATPYAEGVVMLQHVNRPAFPFVRGIDPETVEEVIPIGRFLLGGNLDDLDDESIFISSQLAAQLGVSKGSTVDVYTPLLLDHIKEGEVLLPRSLEVAGIFETGYGAVDANTIVITLRLMQELYGLGNGVHGLSLRLDKGADPDSVAADLNKVLPPPAKAYSWLDINRDLLFVLQLEKTVMFFIILFIILVASFSIASSLLTSVVRKTREIGLLGALGGRPWQSAAIFCLQGFLIGFVGTVLGMAFSVLMLTYRNEIVHTFARWTESEAALIRFYQFVNLPVHYSAKDIVLIIVFTLLISTLAGLIPAWRAARLKPSEALRNE